jgi:hypothetical protein
MRYFPLSCLSWIAWAFFSSLVGHFKGKCPISPHLKPAHAEKMTGCVDPSFRRCAARSQVDSRELPEPLKHDRTCQVGHDLTLTQRLIIHRLPCITVTLAPLRQRMLATTGRGPYASGHFQCQCPVEDRHLCLHCRAWPNTQVPSEPASCHLQWPLFSSVSLSSRSASTTTTSPLQMCQHHQVYIIMYMCVSVFTIIFKELTTQLAMALDPSNDVKLYHSSGTK